jgi:hypothetical protein
MIAFLGERLLFSFRSLMKPSTRFHMFPIEFKSGGCEASHITFPVLHHLEIKKSESRIM